MENLPTVYDRITNWVTKAQEIIANHINKNFTNLTHETLTTEYGNQYVKIVRNGPGNSRSVHAFIALKDGQTKAMGVIKAGDVFMPASWKAPAKHARGNVFDESNGLASVGPYGPDCLRGPNFR